MAMEIIRREMLAEGRIVAYHFDSVGSEAAAEWFEDVTRVLEAWGEDKPFLLLMDVCQSENLLSAEAMKLGRELSNDIHDLPGKTAIIIDRDDPDDLLVMFMNKALPPSEVRSRQTFEDQAVAVAWLLEA